VLNVGEADGVSDGSAVVDGLGLVGRIAGTGTRSSRVIFLTVASSRVPAVVLPSGQPVLVAGDNGAAPTLEFVAQVDEIRPGDRVVTTGGGGLYPPDILIGQVLAGRDGRLRLRPAADYRMLDFVRVLRRAGSEAIEGPGEMIGPLLAAEPEGRP
jgi:rod shape-determining protein MreC